MPRHDTAFLIWQVEFEAGAWPQVLDFFRDPEAPLAALVTARTKAAVWFPQCVGDANFTLPV